MLYEVITVQPVIILFAIPFGFVGAVWGHVIMGFDLSLMSMMGVVALAGVVVNDSLVLIDYANRRRKDEGEDALTAIHSAGKRRFRPIVLTTLTTFGGLAPMIFETSRQARFMIPMALSLGYGILFSTAVTLVLVPCLYMIIEDSKQRLTGLLRRITSYNVCYTKLLRLRCPVTGRRSADRRINPLGTGGGYLVPVGGAIRSAGASRQPDPHQQPGT